MNENLDYPWLLVQNEYMKDAEKPKTTMLTKQENPLLTLEDIFQKIEMIQITTLPFYSDISLVRADLPNDDQHQVTRIKIVNFPSEKSTQVFIELINCIFNKTLVFDSELENVTFSRRMQNYSVSFELTGFNNSLNPAIIAKTDEFLARYREVPNENQFSIEICPIPRAQYPDGRKKLSFKNTADSVLNLIRKRRQTGQ